MHYLDFSGQPSSSGRLQPSIDEVQEHQASALQLFRAVEVQEHQASALQLLELSRCRGTRLQPSSY